MPYIFTHLKLNFSVPMDYYRKEISFVVLSICKTKALSVFYSFIIYLYPVYLFYLLYQA